MDTSSCPQKCFSASITSKVALAYTQTHISLTNHPMRNLCQCGFDHATVLQASCVAKVSIATQLDVTMAAEVAVPSIYQQRSSWKVKDPDWKLDILIHGHRSFLLSLTPDVLGLRPGTPEQAPMAHPVGLFVLIQPCPGYPQPCCLSCCMHIQVQQC